MLPCARGCRHTCMEVFHSWRIVLQLSIRKITVFKCNMVPGLIDLGGLPGVCGLIAPRHLLAVNGRKDTLFSEEAVEKGAAAVRTLYTAAGCPERFEHRWGAEGHRFYKDLMWPFVLEGLGLED